MYYIVAVTGCEPYVQVIMENDQGDAKGFDTVDEAEKYAFENCAWEWRVVGF
jgi:hypothetical protein